MAKLALVKTATGYLPADAMSEEESRKHKKGQVIHADFKKMRNYEFHKKFFALIELGFEAWEPQELNDKFGVVEKNFEQFREDVTIMAGYYERYIRTNGDVRVVAKSISFGSMDEYDFSRLYSSVINVLLNKILTGYKDQTEVERVVNQILEFS